MATIPIISTEQIEVGVAVASPIAGVNIWPSLDPTQPFSIQNSGISNFVGVHNQIGLHNGIGAHILTGLSSLIGLKTGVGGQVNAEPKNESAAPNWSAASPNGNFFGKLDVIGGLFKNGVPVQTTSDIKLKTNIKPLENSLNKVLQLQGVEYDRIDYGNHEIGMIAQEVEKVIPDLVQEDSEGTKVLHYQNLTALLVEAIKEQQEQINALTQTVQELSTKLENCCP